MKNLLLILILPFFFAACTKEMIPVTVINYEVYVVKSDTLIHNFCFSPDYKKDTITQAYNGPAPEDKTGNFQLWSYLNEVYTYYFFIRKIQIK